MRCDERMEWDCHDGIVMMWWFNDFRYGDAITKKEEVGGWDDKFTLYTYSGPQIITF